MGETDHPPAKRLKPNLQLTYMEAIMEIVAVRKNESGTILQYQLDNGQVIGHEEAVNMVESGELEGYNVATARNGLRSIRSNPDGDPSNNLDNLPEYKQAF